jgi:hypothetical protein
MRLKTRRIKTVKHKKQHGIAESRFAEKPVVESGGIIPVGLTGSEQVHSSFGLDNSS